MRMYSAKYGYLQIIFVMHDLHKGAPASVVGLANHGSHTSVYIPIHTGAKHTLINIIGFDGFELRTTYFSLA